MEVASIEQVLWELPVCIYRSKNGYRLLISRAALHGEGRSLPFYELIFSHERKVMVDEVDF